MEIQQIPAGRGDDQIRDVMSADSVHKYSNRLQTLHYQ
jgi:hypothetical protein